MSRASRYFLGLKGVWLAAELLLLMTCEKWMELITGEPSGVTFLLFVYYLGIYLFSLALDRMPGLFTKPLRLSLPMIGAGIAWMVLAASHVPSSAGLVYIVLITQAYLSVIMYTSSSIVMDERVEGKDKPYLLSFQDIGCSLVAVSMYGFSGYQLNRLDSVYVALGIAGGLYLLSFLILARYVRLPCTEDTEAPTEEQPAARVKWIAPCYSLRFM